MNLPPRQQQILELVRERGYVSIEEMATLFVVTCLLYTSPSPRD